MLSPSPKLAQTLLGRTGSMFSVIKLSKHQDGSLGFESEHSHTHIAEKSNKGYSRSETDLEHEFAHGFELFCGVVLSMKQWVVGHLPELHHHVTQLALCREKTRKK